MSLTPNSQDSPNLVDVLLRQNMISAAQGDQIQQIQRARNLKADEAIVVLKIFNENRLADLISQALQIKAAMPHYTEPDAEYLIQVPISFSKKNACLLDRLDDENRVVLLMADPTDFRVIEEVSNLTGRPVSPVASPRSPLLKVIDGCYAKAAEEMETIERERKELEEEIQEANRADTFGFTVSVLSNKGGVGKTHTSINFAYTLARTGRRTLIIDADLGNADVSNKLSLKTEHTLEDFLNKRIEIEEAVMKTPFGFDLIPGKTGALELTNLKYFQRIRFMKAFASMSKFYDYIIYDLGAGLTLQIVDFALCTDHMIVVTTPRDVISGYAALKLTFMRHVELETRLARKMDDHQMGMQFKPWLFLNQVENNKEAEHIFRKIIETSQLFNQQNQASEQNGFQLLPKPLGGGASDYAGYVSAERSNQPYCHLYPNSPNVNNYRNMAQTMLNSRIGQKTENSNLKRIVDLMRKA